MRKIIHGNDSYDSMAQAMDELGISRAVLAGLLKEAEEGRPAMIFGKPIYELKAGAHRVERSKAIAAAAPSVRRTGPLLRELCTHRLGVYHGGGY